MSESNLNHPVEQKTTTSPERALAAFIGAAVGDALGWPFEGRAADKLDAQKWDGQFVDWKKRSGSRFSPRWEQIDAGAYSDDTQLILAISRSRAIEPHWWEYFARVELPFWTCYERGGGGATKRAAVSWLAGTAPWESKAKDVAKQYFEAGGNGAAMRVLPHCVFHARDDDFSTLAANILADGVITHGHPRALVGALAFGYILWSAFKRVDTLDYGSLLRRCVEEATVWGKLPDISHHWPSWLPATQKHVQDFNGHWSLAVGEVLSLCRHAMAGLDGGVLSDDMEVLKELGGLSPKTNGAGTTTAVAALYFASRYAAAPSEGMRCAATSEGADTDTLASMTASLLGVINGMSWLQDYEDKLQDAAYIRQTAECLVFMRKTTVTHSQVTKRNLTEFKRKLENNAVPLGLSLPIGLQVTSVACRQEQRGEHAAEMRVIATDAGFTLFIPSGPTKKTGSSKKTEPKVESLDGLGWRPNGSARISSYSDGDFEPAIGMTLLVKHLVKSREFYEKLLGLNVTGVSQKVVRFSSTLALREDPSTPQSCGGVKLFVNVSDVNSCFERITKAGVESSGIVVRGNARAFECRDPSGYAVEVFERLKAHSKN